MGTLVSVLLVCVIAVSPGRSLSQDADSDQDDRSKERLIRKMKGIGDEDVMARIINLMGVSQNRLGEFFDIGLETQGFQRQIVKELELAINQARQKLRRLRAQSTQKGDERQEGEAAGDDQSEKDDGQSGQSSAGDADSGQDAEPLEAVKSGVLYERKRQWGNLPPRDRHEILQGVNEEIQERFRDQINRYYEALANQP